jgi:hypothetical protein
MTAADRFLVRRRPSGEALLLGALFLALEVLFALVYVTVTRAGITRPGLVVLVPFAWINLSVWVFLRVRPAATDARRRPAALVAVGYFVLLAVLGGVVVTGDGGAASGLRVHLSGFPGWVPLVIADAGLASLVVVPFKLVGYLALSYLVYVTVLDASGTIVGGAVGLFSCVSCTFPLLAGLLSGLSGTTGAAAAVYSNSYLLSTVVFAVTVGLLAWRPTVADFRRLRSFLAR